MKNLDNGPRENFKSLWNTTQNFYISSIIASFKNQNRIDRVLKSYCAEQLRRFLEVLQKSDNRQLLVMDFQREYNAFIQENQSMIEEEKTKEEMHQRVDDL